MATLSYSYIGKGTIYLGPNDGSGALRSIGNVSQLELAVEEDKKELQDYTSPGGGMANTLSRISAVTASLTMHDLSPGNMELALRGTSAEVTGGTSVTNETHTAYLGGLVPFDDLPDTSDTATIEVTDEGATTTYTEGTDYMVTRAGVYILEDGSITDGSTIEVNYDTVLQDVVQALTEAGVEYKLVFDGLNEAQSGKAAVVTLHRTKFSPTSGLGLIGDEFAELPLTADVLSDSSITSAGLSQFAEIQMEQ